MICDGRFPRTFIFTELAFLILIPQIAADEQRYFQ